MDSCVRKASRSPKLHVTTPALTAEREVSSIMYIAFLLGFTVCRLLVPAKKVLFSAVHAGSAEAVPWGQPTAGKLGSWGLQRLETNLVITTTNTLRNLEAQ